MLVLPAKIRDITGKKVKDLREAGKLPAVLYGPKIENKALVLDLKEFEKAYKEAGESSLIKLKVGGKKLKEFQVLIYDVQKDPLTEKFVHVDFYNPELKEEIEVSIPLVFEGEAPAVKELGGVLVKNISEIMVKALPQNLPKEIKVDVSNLETFEDNIQIKDLKLPSGIEVLKELKEIVALVSPPEKIEEEKPVEEEMPTEEKVPAEAEKSGASEGAKEKE